MVNGMKQLTVITDDTVGRLADISYVLGRSKINIESISVGIVGGKALIYLTLKDDARAKQLLEASGYQVAASDVFLVKLPDTPGALADLTKQMADAGINIENVHIVAKGEGYVVDSFRVDKPAKAQKILAPHLYVGSEV